MVGARWWSCRCEGEEGTRAVFIAGVGPASQYLQPEPCQSKRVLVEIELRQVRRQIVHLTLHGRRRPELRFNTHSEVQVLPRRRPGKTGTCAQAILFMPPSSRLIIPKYFMSRKNLVLQSSCCPGKPVQEHHLRLSKLTLYQVPRSLAAQHPSWLARDVQLCEDLLTHIPRR